MKRILLLAGVPLLLWPCATALHAQGSADGRINAAVSPLPDDLRDGAAVMAYAGATLEVIRQGTNEMICLADDPSRDGFHAACYHRSLEPFMERGRELKAQGKSRSEIEAIRLQEIESGSLAFPKDAASLYSLTGPEGSFDPESATISAGGGLWVIYLPYATSEQLGISEVPSRERPWLMAPGKPWAHVMIARRLGG